MPHATYRRACAAFALLPTLGLLLVTGGCKKAVQNKAKVFQGTPDVSHLTATIALRITSKTEILNPRLGTVKKGKEYNCTGTVVSDTLVMTAAHCLVGDLAKVEATFEQSGLSPWVAATSWERDPDYDDNRRSSHEVVAHDLGFATFGVPAIAGATVAKLSPNAVKVDDLVKFVGYGDGDVKTTAGGEVETVEAGPRRSGINTIYSIDDDDGRLLGFYKARWDQSQSTLPGDSGGAIYNAADEVIGVCSGGTKTEDSVTSQHVNIHSPISAAYIQKFIPSFRRQTE